MVDLRPYQKEAVAAVWKDWQSFDKTLLVLPTGTGKTIVFSQVAKDAARIGKVLILAHRDELLKQASDKLYKSTGLMTVTEKADSTCIESDLPVVVGSVQTMQGDKRLEQFSGDYFKTIIVDEAHHALAPSYQKVLGHFAAAKVLGVTATPDRGDMKNLGSFFENLAYEYSLRNAVKDGYLCPIRCRTMPLEIDISNAKISQGDYQLGDIGHALEPYLEDIAGEMAKVCKDRHTVVFLPLISIAQQFRDILNRKGFRAAEVNGESKNRQEILKDFEEGKFNVLCNAMLLTEGWDCPVVDCIVVLRPTQIRGLYCQMIGRGTRLYPGKDHLLVLDFLWMTGKHNLVHPANIISTKDEIAKKMIEDADKAAGEDDADGVDLFEAEEQAKRDVEEERKAALAKMLESSKAQRSKKKTIDPLEYCYEATGMDLSGYVPTFGWQAEKITPKQKDYLTERGFDITGLTKGSANILIDSIIKRSAKGLCTPRQLKTLTKFGFKRVDLWTFEEANSMIARLSAVRWKPWMANVVPEFYVPKRLKGQYELV